MGGYILQFQKLCNTRMRRLALVMGMLVSVVLVVYTSTLTSRNAISPLIPSFNNPVLEDRSLSNNTTPKSMRVGKLTLLSDSRNSNYSSIVPNEVETTKVSDMGGGETNHGLRTKDIDGDNDLDEDGDLNGEFPFDLEDGATSKEVRDPVNDSLTTERVVERENIASLEMNGVLGNGSTVMDGARKPFSDLEFEHFKNPGNESLLVPLASSTIIPNGPAVTLSSTISSSGKHATETVTSSGQRAKETLLKKEALMPLQIGSATSNVNSTGANIPLAKKKKPVMPPVYLSEMNRMLLRNRASYHSMRPRWSSERDKQILAAKARIENAPIVKNEQELYAPLFRNISVFKRSYELMESTLKIYVYKEGKKPIFHQPLLKGIYASEGWFMQLMETNRQFLVKDPRKAHLFYMPFSSRYLQLALYVRNSHKRKNLEQHLENYRDLIAAKYPFWNRTGGADHFLVACHDWAPYETRHTMGRSIRALCNADIHNGFRLGKDISLPETYVRSARNPQRDLGGRTADKRPTLAFYAGNMHGSLRPILVQHWENKDPGMKIFGPMPAGVRSKMSYIQHMKTSKYCICPRGYEVNSPRVVESIFYECVPVIISDNYVLPFFEVLNWEAFSVVLPEKDVPRLKEILESIPEEKYLELQEGVRKVQQHFLWHSKPVKYDLFHMILHSIWFNRVYQIRTR